MKESAKEIVGKRQPRDARPWMKGHEGQHKILQHAVTAHKKDWSRRQARPKPWTETQTDEVERAAQQVKRARTIMRQVPKQWEESWWTNFAEEAEEAGNKRDSTRIFSACKELRDRRERARDGGTQK